MKSEETLLQLHSLKREVRKLSHEIESIRTAALKDPYAVEGLLKMRGLKIHRMNPTERLFFPATLSPVHQAHFYEMMKKYSFRLVLRDMIKHQSRFQVEDLTHYCTLGAAGDYCSFLHDMGVIKKTRPGQYQTRTSPLYSFGPTLEWFTAEMFQREFASPAIYGARLKETASGGDYDVIASWNRRLVYVEVKSSPPKGVEQNEIATFFSRIHELLPEVAILFNDTQLRMKDKLVVMFEEELKRRYGRKSSKRCPVNRLVEELFHVQNRIFIINSKKDIFENFSICLRHYLRNADLDTINEKKH
jgi:hypothetical protein